MKKDIMIVKRIAHDDAVTFYNDLNQVSATMDLYADQIALLKSLQILLRIEGNTRPAQTDIYQFVNDTNFDNDSYGHANNDKILARMDKLIELLK